MCNSFNDPTLVRYWKEELSFGASNVISFKQQIDYYCRVCPIVMSLALSKRIIKYKKHNIALKLPGGMIVFSDKPHKNSK